MQVERHYTTGTPEIVRLCGLASKLYNRCNFEMRKAWFAKERVPNLSQLYRIAINTPFYRQFRNTRTAIQTVRQVLVDWTSFFKTLRAYKRDQGKFLRLPRPPDYKHKLAQVIFYEWTIRRNPRSDGLIVPTNDCFKIHSDRKFKQVVITPKRFGFVIEVRYEKEAPKAKKPGRGVCCIDLGVNNLCAITSDQTETPILVNGRIVKSANQWYNKRQCKKRLKKRYWRLENYFHHVSKWIVEWCKTHHIGEVIIGRNGGWKKGKRKMQGFQSTPFYLLLRKLQYKAEMAGVEVRFTEEAYTSQSSFLDRDPLPAFEPGKQPPAFSGSRIERGLYHTASRLVNADLNGACNIGRKVIQNEKFLLRLDRSLAARPCVVNPLKSFSPQQRTTGSRLAS